MVCMEDERARSNSGWSLLLLLELSKALREADRYCTVQRLLLLL